MIDNENYMREVDVIPDAASALQKCLLQIAEGQVEYQISPRLPSGSRPDIVASFIHDRRITVIGEVKKSGEPKYAREAFYQLERYHRDMPEAQTAFIAPYISPQTARLCRDEKISYMDLAGNCHFSFPGVYIHVEGQTNPFAHSRSLKSLYQPKAERVLRALLHHHPKTWRLQRLADEVSVSIGQTHKVKSFLMEKEWLEETSGGVILSRPKDLLRDWASHYRLNKHSHILRHTLSALNSFERDFTKICRQNEISGAVTSLAAASHYAPHASYQRVTAFALGDLTVLDSALELEPVESGANIALLIPYDEGVFYGARDVDGVKITSPIQTYLDLQGLGGRADEAAEILYEREIVNRW
ncbi:type IV toxin-antitoxin system AbiEi family antitoxin [Capsulimonas corticalis]|nr:type IV toxin-antitoxin system AbiEi family antitoxin [Capsulimonas corticalis]